MFLSLTVLLHIDILEIFFLFGEKIDGRLQQRLSLALYKIAKTFRDAEAEHGYGYRQQRHQ